MRIAFIGHLSEISGSGIALVRLVAGLRGEGIDGELILPGDGPLARYARELEIEPQIIENPEQDFRGGVLQKLALLRRRRAWLARLQVALELGNFDLVYVNSSASIFPGLAARAAGLPIVWHVHETLTGRGAKERIKAAVIRRLSRAICYASESGRRALPHPMGKPWMIALNPINTKELLPMGKARLENQAQGRLSARILMNGTIPLKGADLALAAVATVNAEGVECELAIAGPDPVPPEFAEKLDYLQAQPLLVYRVHRLGMQPSLIPAMKEADLFLSASRTEAMPISIVEAMAAGLPVVATDVGDCRLLLEDGAAGWVVPPESADDLAAAIGEALRSWEMARAKARAAYDKVCLLYGGEDFYKPLADFLKAQIA